MAWDAERESLILDNNRWKSRTEQVLSKYHQVFICLILIFNHQIDPEVHNQLIVAHEELGKERDLLKQQLNDTSSIQEEKSKLIIDLKIEKEKYLKLESENKRLNNFNELLKKKGDDGNKNKSLDDGALAKLKVLEDAKLKAENALVEVRSQAVVRLDTLAKMLNVCICICINFILGILCFNQEKK